MGDCSDGSDESANQCQKDVEVRLAGGNNVTSEELKFNTKASGEQFAMTTLMQRREV